MTKRGDFWSHVLKGEDCWLWQASVNQMGYGRVGVAGRMVVAHRVAYEMMVGPIPPGMDIDHLCHNADATCPGGWACLHRRCVNPAHLVPATRSENMRRAFDRTGGRRPTLKSHCKNGHGFTPENTWLDPKQNTRHCRACARDRARVRYWARFTGADGRP